MWLFCAAGVQLAFGCSRDDGAYMDAFTGDSCLQQPLEGTALDPLGGVRLATNGQPEPAAWDTDQALTNGITYQGSPFAPRGVSTLDMSGTGASAMLGLADTWLTLAVDPGAAGSDGAVLDMPTAGGWKAIDSSVGRVGVRQRSTYVGSSWSTRSDTPVGAWKPPPRAGCATL